MSLIKANAVQIGQSPTATQNFTLAVPSSPDGTIKLARGNAGATTQDVISVDASGNVSFAGTTALGNISNSTAISTGSTTARSLANRFADVVNVKDFGAVGDGVTDDTAAFQSVLNISSSTNNISCFIPNGTFLLNSTPIEGSTKVTWIFDRAAILSGAGKYIPFAPKTNQLDGTPISANIPKISLIEGTPTNPLINLTYKTPSLYLERHTNSNMPDSSTWGNLRKISPITVECYAYANDTSEVNCFAGKAVSYEPVNPIYPNQLVGISSLVESRVTSGKSRDMWAANFIASSGGPDLTRPTNICGIETDIIQDYTMPAIPPGFSGSCNATAYWAQGSGSQTSNSAFFISSTNSSGWLYGLYTLAPFQEYVAFFGNGLNAPNAKGVRINTQWGSDTGRILECFAGGGERFRVDGSSGAGTQSPVWLALNGTMKRIDVGAVDSGGAGYRMLTVLN